MGVKEKPLKILRNVIIGVEDRQLRSSEEEGCTRLLVHSSTQPHHFWGGQARPSQAKPSQAGAEAVVVGRMRACACVYAIYMYIYLRSVVDALYVYIHTYMYSAVWYTHTYDECTAVLRRVFECANVTLCRGQGGLGAG